MFYFHSTCNILFGRLHEREVFQVGAGQYISRSLLKGVALLCCLLPGFMWRLVQSLGAQLGHHRVHCFPLFIGHHSIASILRIERKKGESLGYIDRPFPRFPRRSLCSLWPEKRFYSGCLQGKSLVVMVEAFK